MKTGFGIDNRDIPENSKAFETKVQSMLQVLLEKAVESAAHYVKAANRNTLTPTDIKYALMYEAHEFWERPELDDRFEEVYNETLDGSSSDPNSESDCESGSESEHSGQEDDPFCEANNDDTIACKMNTYAREWNSWKPVDVLQMALKNAIDKMNC